jgi:hypothetical protein
VSDDNSGGIPRSAGQDDVAERLRSAWDRLAGLDAPPEQLSRLRRQLIALCDASKIPGAGTGPCRRRLDEFLAALRSVEKSGYKN